MKKFITILIILTIVVTASAQRTVDVLDRGVVAVKTTGGVFVSWRIFGNEYYDVTYNLYRNGTKLNSTPLSVSNFKDTGGNASSTYQVAAVVRGKEQEKSNAVSTLANDWLDIKMDHGTLTSVFIPNDATAADVDGDGELEILIKFDNQSDHDLGRPKGGNNGEYAIIEVYKLNGKKLWWIDLGPNMYDFQNNENNIVAYDWDQDGKAETVFRAADGTKIHMADGTIYTIGNPSLNYRNVGSEFVYEGAEFLLYTDGATGKPYQCMEYPLKRLESGETSLEAAWGDGYGHRSTKHFFGAPYLDGRKASVFIARGIYTRHKMIAYDVNPATHELVQRWKWTCNTSGNWYGQGYHNYSIADVDMDGRDEICFGSMVIDDNGKGLSTTGLGHGDAHHVGDLDPYRHGLEIFACNENAQGANYRDATTSKLYHFYSYGRDCGRCMAGNFSNDNPGAIGSPSENGFLSCVTDQPLGSGSGVTSNFRTYWDGDLQEESFDGIATNSTGTIYKYGKGAIKSLTGSMTNNDTKKTPCFQGDLFGDWREEIIMRTSDNNIRIYTTTYETPWRNYTLWHDHQYRNAMVWQMCGYNQPPHASYFLGELEGITAAPPALTMTDKTEITNGGTISGNDGNLIVCETNNMSVNVTDGASPYMLTVNTPTWVQGNAPSEATSKDYTINTTTYTHTFKGGAFTGDMRLVKQGDGVMTLPDVVETYTGQTELWEGVLNFNGTMKGSHVWMNRFAELNTAGTFEKGIEMNYASILRPAGSDNRGTVTTDSLILNFGAKVEFDIYGADVTADTLKCKYLKIEKKVWNNGPAYDAPVFVFVSHPEQGQKLIADGKYLIAELEKIEGDISNIVVEGFSDQKATLSLEGTKLYLTVKTFVAGNLTWTGAVNNDWDVDKTKNFVDDEGNACTFTPGSTVNFTDKATRNVVNITTPVSPAAVNFNNSTKAFTIKGDSIVGAPLITKNGTNNVTFSNINRVGKTTINSGKVFVSAFANSKGNDYGSLGDVKKIITIMDGATIGVTTSTACGQLLKSGSGTANLEINNGVTLTMEQGLRAGGSNTFRKTGNGNVILAAGGTITKLILFAGTVNAVDNSLPTTVEFQGGTLYDANTQNSYNTTSSNFIVPEGKTGVFYADPRCNYTGKLTGAGTFTVYAAGIRNYFNGNWSAFTGTLIPGLSKRGSYDPQFDFNNTYGLPNATVKLNSGVTIYNDNKAFAIGNISGEGTLAGNGIWTLGQSVGEGKNFTCALTSASPLIKKGKGEMRVFIPGKLTGTLSIQEGSVRVSKNTAYLNGENTTTITGETSKLYGPAKLYNVNISNGGTLSVSSVSGEGVTMTVSKEVTIDEKSNLELILDDFNSSELNAKTLTLNGNVNVKTNDFTPTDGLETTVWKVTTFTKGANAKTTLPSFAGYDWDTSSLFAPTGILKINKAKVLLGDANGDGNIDVSDITAIAAYILGTTPEKWNETNADANNDGVIDVTDITTTAGIILKNAKKQIVI